MELVNCGSFVQSATAQFERFAKNTSGLQFRPLKHGFWIRDAHGRGLFQGNYTIEWLRPFMPDLRPTDRGQGPAQIEHPRAATLSGREKQLYHLVDDAVRGVDDLVRTSGLPASTVAATLLSLELKRLVKKAPGGFVRAV